jgi:hypothetical protein
MHPCCAGAASIGVIRVNDMAALKLAYHRVVKDLSKARIVAGALVEGGDDDDDLTAPSGNAGSWINVELMLEEVSSAAQCAPPGGGGGGRQEGKGGRVFGQAGVGAERQWAPRRSWLRSVTHDKTFPRGG